MIMAGWDERVANAAELPASARFRVFVEVVAATEELWIVESEDYVLTLDDEQERELLPVWPTEASARAGIDESEWEEGFRPARRTWQQWVEQTTPNLISAKVLVGVFPNGQRGCPLVGPLEVVNAVESWMSEGVLTSTDLSRIRMQSHL